MLMNTINKFEQPNTEQADRRCAFSRSFTRMFDRLCAFLDERIGGASELIDACQSVEMCIRDRPLGARSPMLRGRLR